MPVSQFNIFAEKQEEILNKYINGYSAKELAEEYGFNRLCFPNYVKKIGKAKILRSKTSRMSDRQNRKRVESIYQNFGVINPSQLENKERSRKLSESKKGKWSGRNNPNYGNAIGNCYGFKSGKRKDLNNTFFRSSWEANFARILNYLNIKWEYEPKRFEVKNGKTYSPDFYLPEFNSWIEIKGYWMDDAKEKFEFFKENYDEKVFLIKEKEYKWITDRYKSNIYLEA